MIPYIVIAAALILAGFGAGVQLQEWRYDAKEKTRVQQQIIENRRAAERDAQRANDVIVAQNAAAVRERTLRVAAERNRTALVSLYDAADVAMRRAEVDHKACLGTAAAQDVVLRQCSERYRALAEIADRHASDVETLTDSNRTSK